MTFARGVDQEATGDEPATEAEPFLQITCLTGSDRSRQAQQGGRFSCPAPTAPSAPVSSSPAAGTAAWTRKASRPCSTPTKPGGTPINKLFPTWYRELSYI
ncbi:MAG: hypothetical protein ACLUNZ_04135 [Evtepia sp.]